MLSSAQVRETPEHCAINVLLELRVFKSLTYCQIDVQYRSRLFYKKKGDIEFKVKKVGQTIVELTLLPCCVMRQRVNNGIEGKKV